MAVMTHWPMMAGTAMEEGRRMSSALTNIPLVRGNKPEVDIQLDDQQAGCFVPSYTTLDKIQGTATVSCREDTPFDGVHIILQGATKTFVEKIATSAPTKPRTHAFHNFLRLVQPMDDVSLPEDNVFRAGITYKIPFTFVVPERLLPQACTHAKDHEAVHDAHLAPPPSLGDPMMAGDGKSLLDDLAPNMTIISYGIRVIITRRERRNSGSASKPRALADAMKKLRIIPATEEQPPLSPGADDYILRRTKTVKKGMFQGKLGSLTVSAVQPAPLRLPFIRSTDPHARPTTMATLDLLFEPATPAAKPPKLGQLWAKLKVATFFATIPMRDIPAKADPFVYDSQRGIYVETLPLSSRCVASTQWTKVESGPERRDSGISVSPSAPPSSSPAGLHYTARVLVPVDLPTAVKSFVATFHSCLVSRVYALDLALQATAPSSQIGSTKVPGVASSTTVHLKLPLQIVQDANADATPLISDAEAAHIRAREADQAFVPRSVAPPQDPQPDPEPVADLQLRGARGSVFAAPGWGTVAWHPSAGASPRPRALDEQQRRGSDALWSRRGSDDDDDDDDNDDDDGGEIVEEPAQVLREEMEDEELRGETVRVGANDQDRPPGYTAFNGVVTRGLGMNMWT